MDPLRKALSGLPISRQEGPFPAGMVLHSWAGSNEMVKQLARIEGVYFSLSGHTLRLTDKKLGPMLREVSSFYCPQSGT